MWIAIVHHLPDRTRLRCPTVRRDDDACARLAEALAAVSGVRAAKVRPYTASALVLHDETVALSTLIAAALEATGCYRVLGPGEAPPPEATVPPLSSLAQTTARIVHQLDRDIRAATGGLVDLGTAATIGFLGAGALEVLTTRKLPMPPWFNLAWWGYSTFVTAEQEEIAAVARSPDDG
jgi:hypothetical protein